MKQRGSRMVLNHRLVSLSIAFMAFGLMACGPTQLPKKPSIARANTTSANQSGDDEFKKFLAKADALEGEESFSEQFAEILLGSQLTLMARNKTPATLANQDEQGRCLLVMTAGSPITDDDFAGTELKLSESGRVAYSSNVDMAPTSCQSFFRDAMPERFQADFFNLQVSFFSFDF